MKKLSIIVILILSFGLRINAQGCLPEGIKFTTQEQIDNFQTDYPNCSVIEGYVEIYGNTISNLAGLSSITTIMNELIINSTSITTLEGLENLTKIGSHLSIISNEMLIDLSGFSNLDLVSGNLTIGWNDLITSLSGIDSINSDSIQNLYIRANNSLSACHVQSICNYLTSPNGTVSIYDNASGCNAREEVENFCLNNIQDNSNSNFSIYPNPADKVLFINTENNEAVEKISIYNQFGQRVRLITQPKELINTSDLQPGVYFIKIELKDKIYSDVLLIN